MPTGERHARARQRGFTYVLLLFIVAACGVAAATLGTRWQTQAQREREAELVFRGMQLQDALQRYHDQTPDGQPRQMGDWANMCFDCFGKVGVAIDWGSGQLYVQRRPDEWQCIAGGNPAPEGGEP